MISCRELLLLLFKVFCSAFMSFPLHLLCWNARGGLNNVKKQQFLRFLCGKHQISLLGLVKTKKECLDAFSVNKIWTGSSFSFQDVASSGNSGVFV